MSVPSMKKCPSSSTLITGAKQTQAIRAYSMVSSLGIFHFLNNAQGYDANEHQTSV